MSRTALIVAHGQPSDPAPPEAEMAALAARVGALLPGWEVRSATLADPDALSRALAGVERPVVFPFFMSDGWFIRTLLPRRLAEAGAEGAPILTPFGLLPEAAELAVTLLKEATAGLGWSEAATTLVLAAHGSGASRRPAETAGQLRDAIAQGTSFPEIRLGFIEEPPHLEEVLTGAPPRSLLLPLFVARWGHVEGDIPEAVEATGFQGQVLPPLGTARGVDEIIARAIAAG